MTGGCKNVQVCARCVSLYVMCGAHRDPPLAPLLISTEIDHQVPSPWNPALSPEKENFKFAIK